MAPVSGIALIMGGAVNTMTLSEIAELSMPSDVYITIDNISDNMEYTTTHSGYIQVFGGGKYTNGYMLIWDVKEDRGLSVYNMPTQGNYYFSERVFVPKDRTIKFRSDGSCNWQRALFFYSVGTSKDLGLID